MLGILYPEKFLQEAPFLTYLEPAYMNYVNDIRSSVQLEAQSASKIRYYKNITKSENLIPCVVVWGDSFSIRLNRFLTYNSKEVISVLHKALSFDMHTIKNYQPTLVIDEFLFLTLSSGNLVNGLEGIKKKKKK